MATDPNASRQNEQDEKQTKAAKPVTTAVHSGPGAVPREDWIGKGLRTIGSALNPFDPDPVAQARVLSGPLPGAPEDGTIRGQVHKIAQIPLAVAHGLVEEPIERVTQSLAIGGVIQERAEGTESLPVHEYANQWMLKNGLSEDQARNVFEEQRNWVTGRTVDLPWIYKQVGWEGPLPRDHVFDESLSGRLLGKGRALNRVVNDRFEDSPLYKAATPFFETLKENGGRKDDRGAHVEHDLLANLRSSYNSIADLKMEQEYPGQTAAFEAYKGMTDQIRILNEAGATTWDHWVEDFNGMKDGTYEILLALVGEMKDEVPEGADGVKAHYDKVKQLTESMSWGLGGIIKKVQDDPAMLRDKPLVLLGVVGGALTRIAGGRISPIWSKRIAAARLGDSSFDKLLTKMESAAQVKVGGKIREKERTVAGETKAPDAMRHIPGELRDRTLGDVTGAAGRGAAYTVWTGAPELGLINPISGLINGWARARWPRYEEFLGRMRREIVRGGEIVSDAETQRKYEEARQKDAAVGHTASQMEGASAKALGDDSPEVGGVVRPVDHITQEVATDINIGESVPGEAVASIVREPAPPARKGGEAAAAEAASVPEAVSAPEAVMAPEAASAPKAVPLDPGTEARGYEVPLGDGSYTRVVTPEEANLGRTERKLQGIAAAATELRREAQANKPSRTRGNQHDSPGDFFHERFANIEKEFVQRKKDLILDDSYDANLAKLEAVREAQYKEAWDSVDHIWEMGAAAIDAAEAQLRSELVGGGIKGSTQRLSPKEIESIAPGNMRSAVHDTRSVLIEMGKDIEFRAETKVLSDPRSRYRMIVDRLRATYKDEAVNSAMRRSRDGFQGFTLDGELIIGSPVEALVRGREPARPRQARGEWITREEPLHTRAMKDDPKVTQTATEIQRPLDTESLSLGDLSPEEAASLKRGGGKSQVTDPDFISAADREAIALTKELNEGKKRVEAIEEVPKEKPSKKVETDPKVIERIGRNLKEGIEFLKQQAKDLAVEHKKALRSLGAAEKLSAYPAKTRPKRNKAREAGENLPAARKLVEDIKQKIEVNKKTLAEREQSLKETRAAYKEARAQRRSAERAQEAAPEAVRVETERQPKAKKPREAAGAQEKFFQQRVDKLRSKVNNTGKPDGIGAHRLAMEIVRTNLPQARKNILIKQLIPFVPKKLVRTSHPKYKNLNEEVRAMAEGEYSPEIIPKTISGGPAGKKFADQVKKEIDNIEAAVEAGDLSPGQALDLYRRHAKDLAEDIDNWKNSAHVLRTEAEASRKEWSQGAGRTEGRTRVSRITKVTEEKGKTPSGRPKRRTTTTETPQASRVGGWERQRMESVAAKKAKLQEGEKILKQKPVEMEDGRWVPGPIAAVEKALIPIKETLAELNERIAVAERKEIRRVGSRERDVATAIASIVEKGEVPRGTSPIVRSTATSWRKRLDEKKPIQAKDEIALIEESNATPAEKAAMRYMLDRLEERQVVEGGAGVAVALGETRPATPKEVQAAREVKPTGPAEVVVPVDAPKKGRVVELEFEQPEKAPKPGGGKALVSTVFAPLLPKWFRKEVTRFTDEMTRLDFSKNQMSSYLAAISDVFKSGESLLMSDALKAKVIEHAVKQVNEVTPLGASQKAALETAIRVHLERFDRPFSARDPLADYSRQSLPSQDAIQILRSIPTTINIIGNNGARLTTVSIPKILNPILKGLSKSERRAVQSQAFSKLYNNFAVKGKEQSLHLIARNDLRRMGIEALDTPTEAAAKIIFSRLLEQQALPLVLPSRLGKIIDPKNPNKRDIVKVTGKEVIDAMLKDRNGIIDFINKELLPEGRFLTEQEKVHLFGEKYKSGTEPIGDKSRVQGLVTQLEGYRGYGDAPSFKGAQSAAAHREIISERFPEIQAELDALAELFDPEGDLASPELPSKDVGASPQEYMTQYLRDSQFNPEWLDTMAFDARLAKDMNKFMSRTMMHMKAGVTAHNTMTHLGNTISHPINVGLRTGEMPTTFAYRSLRDTLLYESWSKDKKAFLEKAQGDAGLLQLADIFERAQEHTNLGSLDFLSSEYRNYTGKKSFEIGKKDAGRVGKVADTARAYHEGRVKLYQLEDNIPRFTEFVRESKRIDNIFAVLKEGESLEIRTSRSGATRLRKGKDGKFWRGKVKLKDKEVQRIKASAAVHEVSGRIFNFRDVNRIVRRVRAGQGGGVMGIFSPFLSFPFLSADIPGFKSGIYKSTIFGDVFNGMIKTDSPILRRYLLGESIITGVRRGMWMMNAQKLRHPHGMDLDDLERFAGDIPGAGDALVGDSMTPSMVRLFRTAHANGFETSNIIIRNIMAAMGKAAQSLPWRGREGISQLARDASNMLDSGEAGTVKELFHLGAMTGNFGLEALQMLEREQHPGHRGEADWVDSLSKVMAPLVGADHAKIAQTIWGWHAPKSKLSTFKRIIKEEEQARTIRGQTDIDWSTWSNKEREQFLIDNLVAAASGFRFRRRLIFDAHSADGNKKKINNYVEQRIKNTRNLLNREYRVVVKKARDANDQEELKRLKDRENVINVAIEKHRYDLTSYYHALSLVVERKKHLSKKEQMSDPALRFSEKKLREAAARVRKGSSLIPDSREKIEKLNRPPSY